MSAGGNLKLAIEIGAKIDKSLGSAINNAQKQLNAIGKTANRAMTAATVAVAAAGVKLVKDSIQTYQDYQSALNSAAATAGVAVGSAEYEAMNAAAREAGRTTVKTAEESANALEYMALAGWSVEDSTKALMPVLKLSASTGAELATTSDLVTDSMANLGLGINDLNHYLDVSAAANNKSNQTAMQLQEAYLGVGGVLKNLNSPIEESAAVLGVLANRGTKGSEAGTALNAILVNMQKTSGDAYEAMSKLGVSMYDSNGKARSIIDVFQEISDKTSGMTEENRNLMYQMIGGKSHLDSFAKIMQGFTTDTADGTKEVYSLINAFNNCDGALDKLYDIKMDTLEGSVTRLSSAFNDMEISIGEKIAPNIRDFVDNLTDKIPQIGDIIVNTLDSIAPVATKLLNGLVDNSDKIVSGAIKFAKAFAMFKIGTGAIKGIDSIVTLGKNLSILSKAAGGAKVLQGIIGTFTGIGTGVGTFGSVITTAAGALTSFAAPVAAVAAGLGAAALAIEVIDKKFNYSNGLSKYTEKMTTATQGLVKYNELASTLSEQKEIILNPKSSTEEIDNAKAKIEEIANMLGVDYELTVDCDTSQLDAAISKQQQLNRKELIDESGKYISKVQKGAGAYSEDTETIARNTAGLEYYDRLSKTYDDLSATAATYYSTLENGFSDQATYLSNMNGLYQEAKKQGLAVDDLGDSITGMSQATAFVNSLSGGMDNARLSIDYMSRTIEDAKGRMTEFEKNASIAIDDLSQALASDTKVSDTFGTKTDIAMLTELGQAMVAAGMSTQDLSTKFAAAKSGYTDFATAIADGKAGEMAQSFIDYETQIGEASETAVQGAALIANGFQNVEAATAAGSDAVLAVINNMRSFGDMKGIFDGLDNNGIADKLTDMAHAMGLIPENKSIAINAEGNFEVIQEAENQIASLNSIGNVDVSVNANGDITILDESTNQIHVLEGLGAVDLTVNADGNIDVLDKAGEVIRTIDSKNAQVSINGQVEGMSEVQQAANMANNLDGNSATVTVTATDDASTTISNIQNALTTLNGTQTNPSISASDQASSIIASVSSKLESLDGKTATTVVITKYETQGTPPGENAAGTDYWRGGLTYLNDQPNINDPREVIEYGGRRWYYEGRNVLADIPRGASIYPAAQSASIINGSHRNGLERVPFDGYIAELHAGERVLTDDEAEEYNGRGLESAIDSLRDMLFGSRSGNDSDDGSDSQRQIIYSPQITIQGSADSATVRNAIKMTYPEFVRFMRDYEQDNRRKKF